MALLVRRRHVAAFAAALLLLLLLLIAFAAPVRAADPVAGAALNGPCSVMAMSGDAAGVTVDELEGPGASDPANPFDVDPKGRIAWSGTGPAITTGTYSLTVYGLPVWSGDIDNPDAKTSADGVLDVGDILPIDVVGLIEVSGSVSGTGGSCSGSAWIRLGGEPLTSLPGMAGIGAAIIGLLGVLTAIPGSHPLRGLFAGLLLGIGAGILAIVFGIVPLGALTPLVALGGGGVVGLVLGLLHIGGAAPI